MTIVALVIIVILLMPAGAEARSVSARVDRAHDAVRSRHELGRLQRDRTLSRMARRHARFLVRHHRFTHGNFQRRMRRARYRAVGENLGWIGGRNQPVRSVMRAWMASPGHRANVLGHWGRIGVGVVNRTPSGAPGRTYVVLFARR